MTEVFYLYYGTILLLTTFLESYRTFSRKANSILNKEIIIVLQKRILTF